MKALPVRTCIALLFLLISMHISSQNTGVSDKIIQENTVTESDFHRMNDTVILTSECEASFRRVMVGEKIGSKGMKSEDIDNDGIPEIISANPQYWQIMEYDSLEQSYNTTWMSRFYGNTGTIDMLDISDIDHDGEPEIIVASSYIYVEIFNARTRELETQITLPEDYYAITAVFSSDADNDGNDELVIGTLERTFLFRRTGTGYIYEDEHPAGGTSLKAADVDNDGQIELVYPARIMRVINGAMLLVWQYSYSGNDGIVELYDVDSDGTDEIIYASSSLFVYDADNEQMKWSYPLLNGSDAVLHANVNAHGRDEIIVAESNSGIIYCLRASDGGDIWSLGYPAQGLYNMCAGDFDNDGTPELTFAREYTYSYPYNNVYIYSLADQSLEWISKDVFGPYDIIRIADVDGDQKKELISFTTCKGPYPISFKGNIEVFDAESGVLEWQSDDTLLIQMNNELRHGFQIYDIDNDGSNEIVIASSTGSKGAIWVINGVTHEIESYNIWPLRSDIDNLSQLQISDVDENGSCEYVTLSYSTVTIINPVNYDIIWQSNYMPYGGATGLICGNIDHDSNPEMITVNDKVIVFDGVTKQSWFVSYTSPFTSVTLYDYDGDGIDDIFAGTEDGRIVVVNGITQQLITLPVFAFARISALYVGNLNGDESPEIIYMSPDMIYFTDLQGSEMKQLVIPNDVTPGRTALTVGDYNNDGIEDVFAGTNFGILQINPACYECGDFNVQLSVDSASCNYPDGSVIVDFLNGHEPYTYLWSTGENTSTLTNVPSGSYSVIVNDNAGCSAYGEVIVPDSVFRIDNVVITDDYTNTTDCEGTAVIFPTGGHAPYHCVIQSDTIEMANNTVSNLCEGSHSITFIDAGGCTVSKNIQIQGILGIGDQADGINFSVYPVPSQNKIYIEFPEELAYPSTARLRSVQGVLLKTVNLDLRRTDIDIIDLEGGVYLLTVTCRDKTSTKKLIKL